MALFGKYIINSAQNLTAKNKMIHNIKDEIWEIINEDELLPFSDYINI